MYSNLDVIALWSWFLGSHTYSVRAFCFGRRVCRLSVPRQISKIKRDRREISSSLWEIGVGEQEYDVRIYFAPEVAKYSKK